VNVSELNFCIIRFLLFFLTNRQLSINYKQGFAELRDGLAPHSQSLGLPTITNQAELYRKIRTLFRSQR